MTTDAPLGRLPNYMIELSQRGVAARQAARRA